MSLSKYLNGIDDSDQSYFIENTKIDQSSKRSQQKMWEQLYASHQRPIYQKMLTRVQQSIDFIPAPNFQIENV